MQAGREHTAAYLPHLFQDSVKLNRKARYIVIVLRSEDFPRSNRLAIQKKFSSLA